MIFPDDIRQDIKTFWGIPLSKLLKILVPLGLILAGYILWFPFPDNTVWRMGLAVVVFIVVAGSIALNLPRFFGIYRRYRQRPKLLQSKSGVKGSGNERTCLQDLIRVDMLHFVGENVLVEWDNGWISMLCYCDSEPIDYESAATVSLIQKGLKDALAVASSNSLRLNWIADADYEYDEDFWNDRREQAIENILPGGRELTLERMDDYARLAKQEAVRNQLFMRIDASLVHLMRDENGETDLERKERALATFAHTVGSFINTLRSAKLHLTPMNEDELVWIIQQEVAPWTRGTIKSSQITEDNLYGEKSDHYEIPPVSAEEPLENKDDDKSTITLNDPEYTQENAGMRGSNDIGEPTLPRDLVCPPSISSSGQPIKNPFKKTMNPFAKNTSKEPMSLSKSRQKVLPFLKTMQFPDNVVVVFSTKRYVGVTTVAVNLTPAGARLINLGRGEQPVHWPEHFSVSLVSGEQRVSEIVEVAKTFSQVTVDLGQYTEDCRDILKAAQRVVYVTDNQANTLGASLQQTDKLPTEKMILAINKAIHSGLSPGLLSTQLGMPIGIMIPFDSSYDNRFGLSLPRKPWEIFRHLINDREESVL